MVENKQNGGILKPGCTLKKLKRFHSYNRWAAENSSHQARMEKFFGKRLGNKFPIPAEQESCDSALVAAYAHILLDS